MIVKPSSLSRSSGSDYAAAFCALGFEERARYVASVIRPHSALRFAVAFEDRHLLSYGENRDFFAKNRYEIIECRETDLRNWLRIVISHIDKLAVIKRKVLIDISSMSRTRISLFVEEFCLGNWSKPTTIDFVYAPAQYSPPPEMEAANTHVGPVSTHFAGWAVDPDLIPAVILGLGYEQDRALGAVEHIQPGDVWAFMPVSQEEAYGPALTDANAVLLEQLPESRLLSYDVAKPFDCFGKLASLVAGLNQRANPIFVPFGPKIFALCSMLVAAPDPRCAVWRVSAGESDHASERIAAGTIVGLSVVATGEARQKASDSVLESTTAFTGV